MGFRQNRYRDKVVHVHKHSGGGLVGGILGGFIGSVIANAESAPPTPAKSSEPVQPKPSNSSLEKALAIVTSTPSGATVYLTIDEFRILKEKSLIVYKDTVPYCMDRIIQV